MGGDEECTPPKGRNNSSGKEKISSFAGWFLYRGKQHLEHG